MADLTPERLAELRRNDEVAPHDGGCWYCYKMDENLVFSIERDAYVHLACVREALERDPQDAALILRWVVACNKEANVYWSPLVYANPSRRKEEAHQATSLWAWADLDAVDPRTLDPVPTILWASSPGKYQSLYRLAERVDAATLEELNKRIAHASKADPSGVDAGQVLRWPGTRNWKYEGGPKGKVLKVTGA